MNWKDWLFISKSDKVAILCLTLLIAILLIISLFINTHRKNNLPTLEPKESVDYIAWKSQLTERKAKEQKIAFEKYKKSLPYTYQPKMKPGKTIDINTADTAQLKMIPGIGSGFANRIVSYRERLGGYMKLEQLNEVWGLDTYLYSKITPYLTITPKYTPLYINKIDFDELLKHPYLNYKQASVIIDIRKRKGPIKSLKRLQLLEEFSRRDLELLALYINFDE